MTTYAWQINKLQAIQSDGLENIVTRIVATLNATSEDGFVTHHLMNVAAGPWSAGEFIAFEELTQDVVIGWLEACLGEAHLAEIKAGMELRFADMRAAMLPPPWETSAV